MIRLFMACVLVACLANHGARAQAHMAALAALGSDMIAPVPVAAEEALKAQLADPKAFRADKAVRSALQNYYEARHFTMVWISDGKPTPQAAAVRARLDHARFDGFEPRDYTTVHFSALKPDAAPEEQVRAELDLWMALLSYARHAAIGRIDPARLGHDVAARSHPFDVSGVVATLGAPQADPVALLEALHPTHPGFLALKKELARLLEQPETPARVTIPEGASVRLGGNDRRVLLLRERFSVPAASPDVAATLDGALVGAIRRFQETRDLPVTGTLNTRTVRALNAEQTGGGRERIPLLLVNMERWRWLPHDLGEHRVVVSVPEYLVRVFDDQLLSYEGRVVVGKEKTPTPIFSASIEYLVVNPSWHVPPNILKKEILPLYYKNPAAVARMGLVPTHTPDGLAFRQPPGERNALGRIKFMFPNDYSVYLHDTPSRSYFERDQRAFSHGCVRVDQPLRFADILLAREKNINARQLEAWFGKNERNVHLVNKVPVHITYFTTTVDANGQFRHFSDIYGIDAKMRQLMGV